MNTIIDGPDWRPLSTAPKCESIFLRHVEYGLLPGHYVVLSSLALLSYDGEKIAAIANYDHRFLEWSHITKPA